MQRTLAGIGQLVLKRLHPGWAKMCPVLARVQGRHLCGVMVISRRVGMRLASGGGVQKKVPKEPPPKSGFTMHNEEVEGEMAVVGIRLLYAPSFSRALISP